MQGLIKYESVKQSPTESILISRVSIVASAALSNFSGLPPLRLWMGCGLRGTNPCRLCRSSPLKVSKELRDNDAAQVTLINDLLLSPGGINHFISVFLFSSPANNPGRVLGSSAWFLTQSELGTILTASHYCGTFRQPWCRQYIFQQAVTMFDFVWFCFPHSGNILQVPVWTRVELLLCYQKNLNCSNSTFLRQLQHHLPCVSSMSIAKYRGI